MEQYTEKHYDDDLTVVEDDYNESFHTDSVDLFEFPSNDESPIARLKSLVLSIDWEITDDILRQFNEELVDLKDVWADEKIYLVYVQALEKISKYIYQEKADSNPNAIKLLLTFFYNLEKMVSSEFMSEEEKRQIVLEDVKKFEMLKRQIGRAQNEARMATGEIHVDEMQPRHGSQMPEPDPILLDLKAIVLGMDWEITEKDLEKLRNEVVRLEEVFAGSRPKLIFLQGLGSLAAYIRLKKSDAHADAFKLLHSFFAGLERIVTIPMSLEEEKAVLLPEVEKFNAFKAVIASTIAPEVTPTAVEVDEEDEDDEEYESGDRLAPALSDLPEGEVRGFREEDEAVALGLSPALAVTSQIDRFFAESPEEEQARAFEEKLERIDKDAGEAFRDATEAHLDSLFQLDADADVEVSFVPHVDQEFALQGVDVESEADDDSEEAGLPFTAGQPAPALAALGEEFPAGWKMPEEESGQIVLPGDVAQRVDELFDEDASGQESELTISPALPEGEEKFFAETSGASFGDEIAVPEESDALQGVDVETDEDDYAGGDLAPAFADVPIAGPGWQEPELEKEAEDQLTLSEPAPALYDQISVESGGFGRLSDQDESVAGLEDHLDSFFGFEEEKDAPEQPAQDFSVAEGADAGGDLAPALSDVAVSGPGWQAQGIEEEVEEQLDLGEPVPALSGHIGEEAEPAGWMGEQDKSVAGLEDHLDSFFGFEEEKDAPEQAAQDFSVAEVAATGGDPAPALSDVAVSGPGWQAQDIEEEAEEQLDLGEPAPALSGHISEEAEPAGWMGEQDKSVAGLEDHLDSFFGFEEEKDSQGPAAPTISLAEEIPAVESSGETISEAIEEQIEEIAGVSEDFPGMPDASVVAGTPSGEPEVETSSFDMAAPEGEKALTEVPVQFIAAGEEADQDMVFDLAGAEDEFFAGPAADESRGEPETPEQELLAAEFQDIPDIFQEAPEAVEEVAEQTDYSAVTVPDAVAVSQADEEFLAVFEEADETAEEEVWPDRVAARVAEPASEGAVAADLEEIAGLALAADETTGEGDLFLEEGGAISATEDPLSNLHACVSSVGIELEDSIFKGIYTEINDLRSRWATHPLEKSFLQLVSTITQHIDQYRYESSSEAFSLLQSVVKAFGEALEWHHPAAAQEMLLKEMTKVLLWQQGMLTRQAVTKGDALTFAAPIRHQPGEALADEEISFAEEEAEDEFPGVFEGAGEDRAADEDLTSTEEEIPIEKDIWFAADDSTEPGLDQMVAGESATVEGLAKAETAGSEILVEPEEKIPAERGPLAEYDSDVLEEEIRLSSDSLYSELEAVLAGERLASSGEGGYAADDAALADKIRALMQNEFALIRQEMQSQVEALRRELKGKED